MNELFSRTQLLFGKKAMQKLSSSRVAVFGVGGVGGYAVEALARSGVGAIDLIDHDVFSLSNLNRQIHATLNSVGKYKVEVAAARIAEINPQAVVRTHIAFFTPETASTFDFSAYDYVIDAIDTVAGKISLVLSAQAAGVPIISAMGAGNKLDPTAFEVADIYKTSVCPLARVMRVELKKRGVRHLKVVYSKELPLCLKEEETDVPCASPTSSASLSASAPSAPFVSAKEGETDKPHKKQIPGSTAFVPSVVGLILAGEVIKDLTVTERKERSASH